MNSPPSEDVQTLMEAAHDRAAKALGLTCMGPLAWGFQGVTLGRQAGNRWLRVSRTAERNAGRKQGEGIVGASLLVPDAVPRPRLYEVYDWTDGEWAFEAEVLGYVTHPVVSPERADLHHDPHLPDEWWVDLRRALALLTGAEGARATVRDGWIERAFPQFLGIPAPAKVERVTGHGDLHWGNLTTMPLTLLDWERWGRVPYGYDAGLLHANSLLVPDVADRIRLEFASVLDTPAGRVGELAALAEMLQAVARGWYPDLAPRLLARAESLTGVRPSVPVHSEVST
ncbi:hypothetical protein SAMN05428945_3955 [Streptomyces sp. 2224.1]|uniref:hypothetical protein n=1 Tax=unclassified Streptomyces TaxID=2593676 RepID=UPI00088DCC56|nr:MULTISPECIES: hypothetical protein [unclassified Streptomyces]PBC81506.1 hypothetical protein BX261_1382 [Streptomyces sp. 2321.6]SDR54630.1 hypothetical protein SAMN05216511_5834 [Streptomyces sp. KS_16]SEC18132.1 hypothetical protein SAMN05428940_1382 [Streptomyces sp. 2133.1]SED13778.1 hypothetical protein SAMN05428945_3955 [Streptomyces sp. 2224.1]SEF07340.1 hypothetical protein SAMN05428954_5897 [Streptomyces sp. 2112.3]